MIKPNPIPLLGVMDSDTPEDVYVQGRHTYAENITFRGEQGQMRVENIRGTRLVNFTPPTGTNLPIGKFYDTDNNRLFWFNYNSLGTHGIYIIDTITELISTLIVIGTGTDGDVLGFAATEHIDSINIIYGDEQQGDILYWVDSLGRPSKININRALLNGYGQIKRTFLDVAKEPASIPPLCAYEDDNTVTLNTLRGNLFKFKIRFYFDDNDTSVTSSASEMPVPFNEQDPLIASDQTKNAMIAIVFQTGDTNVKKIELLGSINTGVSWGDWFSIEVLDKTTLYGSGLQDNSTYEYFFYNDKTYNYIDTTESVQLFDYVPIEAGNQEALNGNVLIYGDVTDNYDPANVVGSITKQDGAYTVRSKIYLKMSATQNGDSGAVVQDGNIVIRIVGEAQNNYSLFYVFCIDSVSGSSLNIYTSGGQYSSRQDIIDQLSASAVSIGFTIIDSDSNHLTVYKQNAYLYRSKIIYQEVLEPNVDCLPSYDYSNGVNFALAYFDSKGRTVGAVTIPSFSVKTDYIGKLSGEINIGNETTQFLINLDKTFIPPMEAEYYHVLRSSNPTKSRMLYWVTDRAYTGTDFTTGIDYSYLSIANLTQYITDNPATASQLTYSFADGDRIKILQNKSSDTLYTTLNDIQIQGSITDPTINGVTYSGMFLKILTPVTGSGIVIDGDKSNFKFLVEIYSPTKPVSSDTIFYYEFGQMFGIGNPHTNTRYHQGNDQNQTPDYSNGAIINLYGTGDAWYRTRNIYAGNKTVFTFTQDTLSVVSIVDGYPFQALGETSQETFTSDDYVVHDVVGGIINSEDDAVESDKWWIYTKNYSGSFALKGEIYIYTEKEFSGTPYVIEIDLFQVTPANIHTIRLTTYQTYTPAGGTIKMSIDTTFTPMSPANTKIFIGFCAPDIGFIGRIVGGFINVTEQGNLFTIPVIDKNFSDFYPSAVNSNGRGLVTQPTVKQVRNGALVRYSQAYQIGTTINGASRFYSGDYDQYDNTYGDIVRMKLHGHDLRIFQYRRCGMVPILASIIKNQDGSSGLIASDQLLNPIQYYEGDFGIGNQASSLVSSSYVDYFTDPVKGYILRLSRDGLQPISLLYFMHRWASANIPKYLTDWAYTNGGNAKICGTFYINKDKEPELIYVLQGGTVAGTLSIFSSNTYSNTYEVYFDGTVTAGEVVTIGITDINGNIHTFSETAITGDDIPSLLTRLANEITASGIYTSVYIVNNDEQYGIHLEGTSQTVISGETTITSPSISQYTLSFDEKRNAFTSFYKFYPDNIICCETKLITFLSGKLYVHDSDVYNTFYDMEYESNIEIIGIQDKMLKKEFTSLGYRADNVWTSQDVGDIKTSLKQNSSLMSVDFENREGYWYAAFWRDSNGVNGVIDGDYLKGEWIKLKLRIFSPTIETIYSLYVNYKLSQKIF